MVTLKESNSLLDVCLLPARELLEFLTTDLKHSLNEKQCTFEPLTFVHQQTVIPGTM